MLTAVQSNLWLAAVSLPCPVGVLYGLAASSRIVFFPPLPLAKRLAISRLAPPRFGAATHNKVVLRFHPKDMFWDADVPHLECPDPRVHLLNLHLYGKSGVLMAHVWGGAGMDWASLTDQQVVEVASSGSLGYVSGEYTSSWGPSTSFTNTSDSLVGRPFFIECLHTPEKLAARRPIATLMRPVCLWTRHRDCCLQEKPLSPKPMGLMSAVMALFESGVDRARRMLCADGCVVDIPQRRIVDYLMGKYAAVAPSHPRQRRGSKGDRQRAKNKSATDFAATTDFADAIVSASHQDLTVDATALVVAVTEAADAKRARKTVSRNNESCASYSSTPSPDAPASPASIFGSRRKKPCFGCRRMTSSATDSHSDSGSSS